MKKVLLFCYLAVMLSLVSAFVINTWHQNDDALIQYEHTVSVITDDMYDQLILDGWVLDDTVLLYTDTVYVLEYTDTSSNVSTMFVKVVTTS